MVGMKTSGFDEKIRPLLPSYMTHGQTGMDMGKMAEVMAYPRNTISMKGATGQFGDYISMGSLFTILKVRDALKSYDEDSGWYQHPPGTVALKATEEELARDGIDGGPSFPEDLQLNTRGDLMVVVFPISCDHDRDCEMRHWNCSGDQVDMSVSEAGY